MSENDPFGESQVPAEEVNRQQQKMSGCAMAAIGCGALCLVLAIVAAIGMWWLAQNARQFGAELATRAFKQGLNELDIPDDQRQRINARIDKIGQKFKEEKITLQEVTAIFEKISEGPLMPAGIALVAERTYIRDSGLSEEEKAEARVSIQRFAHGVIETSIPEARRKKVLDLISTVQPDGNRQFKQSLTDKELREFIQAAGKAADDAGVPEKVPEINFADEFDKAVDEALGKAPAGSENADAATEPEPEPEADASAEPATDAAAEPAADEKAEPPSDEKPAPASVEESVEG